MWIVIKFFFFFKCYNSDNMKIYVCDAKLLLCSLYKIIYVILFLNLKQFSCKFFVMGSQQWQHEWDIEQLKNIFQKSILVTLL